MVVADVLKLSRQHRKSNRRRPVGQMLRHHCDQPMLALIFKFYLILIKLVALANAILLCRRTILSSTEFICFLNTNTKVRRLHV